MNHNLRFMLRFVAKSLIVILTKMHCSYLVEASNGNRCHVLTPPGNSTFTKRLTLKFNIYVFKYLCFNIFIFHCGNPKSIEF